MAESQATGTLVVSAREVEAVSAIVRDGAGEELLVSSHGLRIGNRAESRASYEVILPTSLEGFEVRVGDSVVLRRKLGSVSFADRWTVPLTGREPR